MTDNDKRARELHPCPFCGGDAHLESHGHVCCKTRFCRGAGAFDNYGTPTEQNASAISRWNTRDALRYVPAGFVMVPVEPTPEMVKAAEDAYMPFGDMGLAIQMAIAASPNGDSDGVDRNRAAQSLA